VGEARTRGTSRTSALNKAVALLGGAGTAVVAVGLAISHAATVHRSLEVQPQAESVTRTEDSRVPHPRPRRRHHHVPAAVVLPSPVPTAVPPAPTRSPATAPATPRPTPAAAVPTSKPAPRPTPPPPPVSPTSAPPTAVSHGS